MSSSPDDPRQSDRTPEYSPEQVAALTARSEELLVELHAVMREMANRLQVLAKGD